MCAAQVVGSAASALEAVVAADVELMELRSEEKELCFRLEHSEQHKVEEVNGTVKGLARR